MNRIHSLPLESDSLTFDPVDAGIGSAVYSPAREGTPCALFAPLHYESNYSYPLLVWLHGPDDDEGQLKRIMPLLSMRNYVAIAPRGTMPSGRGKSGGRFTWGHSAADLVLAEQRVLDAIGAAKRKFHVHPQRVFLAGYDQGGTMALRLALLHPERFAGVLSLGGSLPSGRCLPRLHEARRLMCFLAAGAVSQHYPAERVCDDLRLLHSAGMSITLRLYPCGQTIAPDMLADMNRWMMELVTGGAEAPART